MGVLQGGNGQRKKSPLSCKLHLADRRVLLRARQQPAPRGKGQRNDGPGAPRNRLSLVADRCVKGVAIVQCPRIEAELEEAALLDGAEVWRQFWSIALPAIQPALETVVLLDLLTHWSDFLWPLLMSTRVDTRTVQVALAGLFTAPPVDWGAILACAVLSTVPVL